MGLGDPGVDLQSRLGQVARFFFQGRVESCHVFIHEPRENNLYRFSVVISVKLNGREVNGSSSGLSLYNTFLKALCELGENIITSNLGLNNRSGVAGGLILNNCIDRAKAELIERDAFLYHYRNLIPFRKSDSKTVDEMRFELNSVDPSFSVNLVMNREYLEKKDSCLILGVAGNKDALCSSERAYCEYSSMYLNHKEFINCSNLRPVLEKSAKVDFHHHHSKSWENKTIFKKLCLEESSFEKRSYDDRLWKIEELNSPLLFFKYVRAEHPELIKLEFGLPELFPQFENLVYHPFW